MTEQKVDLKSLMVTEEVQLATEPAIQLRLDDFRGHLAFKQRPTKWRALQFRSGRDADGHPNPEHVPGPAGEQRRRQGEERRLAGEPIGV